MKRLIRIVVSILLTFTLIFSSTVSTFAHSGRTDGSGGHKDNKNKSGLGSYHYHCGGYPAHLHTSGYCPYKDVFPKSVEIKVGKTTLGIGERISISASVSPSNACNTYVDLSSSDEEVIEIRGDELVAVGYGTATITGESFNGKTRTVTITVKEIKADSVSIASPIPSDQTVYIGDSLELSASINPENVDDPSIVWSSSNEKIATVDQNGHVKTLAKGEVTIYAKAANGVTGKKTLAVKEKFVESVELSEVSLDLLLHETHTLVTTVTPADATFPEITWSSSDSSVAEVSENGTVFAIGCGSAVITATSTNGITASVPVSVTEIIAERIKIIGGSQFYPNESAILTADIYPENTTIKDVVWSSNDPTIANIDENGNLKCLAPGVVTITATQKDVATSIHIVVKVKPVERIEIQSSAKKANKLSVGKSMTLTATVYPDDATYRDVSWASSDPAIATVDADGNVTAMASGNVIITATTQEGILQTLEIKVIPTLRSIFSSIFDFFFRK